MRGVPRVLRWDKELSEQLTADFCRSEVKDIDDGTRLRCSFGSQCEPSVGARSSLVAGQLSWVGPRYALVSESGVPVRILIVPKQTGRGGDGHSHVTHAQRAAQANGA